MNTDVITPDEVSVLNAARRALEALRTRNRDTAVQGTAGLAEWAVFSVLNDCNAYLDADLTDAELHGPQMSA